jgi:DNA primase large subunit
MHNPMTDLYAKYPFLSQAKEAVSEMDIDISEAATQKRVVDRSIERIEMSISEGKTGDVSVGSSEAIELLSYPISRILVSIVGDRKLIKKFAKAEAETAVERLTYAMLQKENWATIQVDWLDLRYSDAEKSDSDLKSVESSWLSLDTILREFDLQESVREKRESIGNTIYYTIGVCDYLNFYADSRSDDSWRLINRSLSDGRVELKKSELLAILRDALYHRIVDDLPFDVPESIENNLVDAADYVRDLLGEYDLERSFDTVDPDAFPPCMAALVERARTGELPPRSRFSLVSFLAAAGMDADEIATFCAGDDERAEAIRYTAERVVTEAGPVEYAPPGCVTMDAYGDCVNKDERCERIEHPLAYYGDAL